MSQGKKSCTTCKFFVPPTPATYWHPGDPWECQEPKIGAMMTAHPPVKKGYCKRWTPKTRKYRCFDCGKEYTFIVPDPDIPWTCECGGPLMVVREEEG